MSYNALKILRVSIAIVGDIIELAAIGAFITALILWAEALHLAIDFIK